MTTRAPSLHFKILLASIGLASVCLFAATENANAAVTCQTLFSKTVTPSTPGLFSGIKRALVDPRASKMIEQSENEYQRTAIESLRAANLFSKFFYRIALETENPFQIKVIQELIYRRVYDESIWRQVQFIQNIYQQNAAIYILEMNVAKYYRYLEYLNDIQSSDQLKIFLDLAGSGIPVGKKFWASLNATKIRTDFMNDLSRDDIIAFSKLDGFPPSISKDFGLMMLRFSKRDNVLANIEILGDKTSYVLTDDNLYAKIDIRKNKDRLRIVVHEVNIAPGKLRYGEATTGLNQRASEFMSLILLFAARQSKLHPEFQEIEILAQNIVNENLIRTLRSRLFHDEDRKEIPNFSKYTPKGVYLRASIFNKDALAGQSVSELTLNLLKQQNHDISRCQDIIKSFTNVYQYMTVRELINKGEKVAEFAQDILQFNNWHQVSALQIMLDNNLALKTSIKVTAKFDNEFQTQALTYAALKAEKGFELGDDFALITNQNQVNAIEMLAKDKQETAPHLDDMRRSLSH